MDLPWLGKELWCPMGFSARNSRERLLLVRPVFFFFFFFLSFPQKLLNSGGAGATHSFILSEIQDFPLFVSEFQDFSFIFVRIPGFFLYFVSEFQGFHPFP